MMKGCAIRRPRRGPGPGPSEGLYERGGGGQHKREVLQEDKGPAPPKVSMNADQDEEDLEDEDEDMEALKLKQEILRTLKEGLAKLKAAHGRLGDDDTPG